MKLSKLERVRETIFEYTQELEEERAEPSYKPYGAQTPLHEAMEEMREAHALLRKAIDHYREYLVRREMA